MTLKNLAKFPSSYYGGKTDAIPHLWAALGDVPHYVAPFCGSCVDLLLRPHPANRAYYSETVNDLDGLLVNALRSIHLSPDATAEAASWYVSEADLIARHLAILKWKAERDVERLMADPHYHDPVIGGWWIYGMSCWIGSGFASGQGPWGVGADGRITRQPQANGVWRQRPHLGNNGQGVNHAGAREPGVARQIPHLGDNGQGVNHAGAREPGVATGRGEVVPRQGDAAPLIIPDDLVFHETTMPEVRRWFAFLSARLRHVRIVNGDWRRVVTPGAAHTLEVRMDHGPCGIFLDPPYAAGRAAGLYTHDSFKIASEVAKWAVEHGGNPRNRIVYASFAGDHDDLFAAHGWRAVVWFRPGYLKGGMGNQSDDGHQQERERLWCSPHCLQPARLSALPMFAMEADDA